MPVTRSNVAFCSNVFDSIGDWVSGEISVQSSDGGSVLSLPMTAEVTGIDFKGDVVVFCSGGQLYLISHGDVQTVKAPYCRKAKFDESTRRIAVGFANGRVGMYDLTSNGLRASKEWEAHERVALTALVWLNSFMLATASYNGTITVWDADDGTLWRTLQIGGSAAEALQPGPIEDSSDTNNTNNNNDNDEKWIKTLFSGHINGHIRKWRVDDGSHIDVKAHSGSVVSLALVEAANGRESVVVSCSDDKSVSGWSAATLAPIWSMKCENWATSLTVAADLVVVGVFASFAIAVDAHSGSVVEVIGSRYGGHVMAVGGTTTSTTVPNQPRLKRPSTALKPANPAPVNIKTTPTPTLSPVKPDIPKPVVQPAPTPVLQAAPTTSTTSTASQRVLPGPPPRQPKQSSNTNGSTNHQNNTDGSIYGNSSGIMKSNSIASTRPASSSSSATTRASNYPSTVSDIVNARNTNKPNEDTLFTTRSASYRTSNAPTTTAAPSRSNNNDKEDSIFTTRSASYRTNNNPTTTAAPSRSNNNKATDDAMFAARTSSYSSSSSGSVFINSSGRKGTTVVMVPSANLPNAVLFPKDMSAFPKGSGEGKVSHNINNNTAGTINNIVMKGDNDCSICLKKIYATEKVEFNKIGYHKSCFKCWQCGTKLTTANIVMVDNLLFCKIHSNRSGAAILTYGKARGSRS